MGNFELGPQLAQGALCDKQESLKFFVASPLVAFGNIGGNGNGGALHLIPQTEVSRKFSILGDFVDFDGQGFGFLPDP